MSSVAAVQADGYYYPPTYEPAQGSVSKAFGSKGSNQYQLHGVIRFEMPCDCWCLGCKRPIGRGTRFNAKKKKAGNYYSTTIWSFEMKCPSCSTLFLIKTDPKNTDYEFAEGARRKETEYDPVRAGTEEFDLDEERIRRSSNAMAHLEHVKEDQRKAEKKKTRLCQLMDWSDMTRSQDYDSNAKLRQSMRERRNRKRVLEDEAHTKGLGIRLLSPSPADAAEAKRAGVGKVAQGERFKRSERKKLAMIRATGPLGGTMSGKQVRAASLMASLGPDVTKKLRSNPIHVQNTSKAHMQPQGVARRKKVKAPGSAKRDKAPASSSSSSSSSSSTALAAIVSSYGEY